MELIEVRQGSLEDMLSELKDKIRMKLRTHKLSEYEINQIALISCEEFRHRQYTVNVRTLSHDFVEIKVRVKKYK
jgi:predicted DNA binding CopG/RHH family protein